MSFAAHGGVYILASLAWLRIVEEVKLTIYDVAGVALSPLGACVILPGGRLAR